LHVPQKGTNTLVIGSGKLFLTKKRFEYRRRRQIRNDTKKYVGGRLIAKIMQHDFDRVVIIKTETHNIIAELFRNGNVILTDTETGYGPCSSARNEGPRDKIARRIQISLKGACGFFENTEF